MRYITSDSYHCFQQKMSAFNSMIYRMVNIPMEKDARTKEEKYIFDVARVNGYADCLIQTLIDKHERSKSLHDQTTLLHLESGEKRKYMKVTYYPPITDKMAEILNSVNVALGFSSVNKIGNRLCCNKDQVDKKKRSGIYKLLCDLSLDGYIGQSSRPYCVRCVEHLKSVEKVKMLFLKELCESCVRIYDGTGTSKKRFCVKCKKFIEAFQSEIELSAVAKHYKDNINHKLNIKNSVLLKQVRDDRLLDSRESFFMYKYSDNLTLDHRT